jgi:hypothetical protein
MLFLMTQHGPVPIPPRRADGATFSADGALIATLEQAARRTGTDRASLRQGWIEFALPWADEDDARVLGLHRRWCRALGA